MKNYLLIISIIFLSELSFSQNWTNIGPDGGFFKDFVIHPTNSNIVYAGSDDGGGVWKSIDSGNSWILLTRDYPNFTGWHIEIDMLHPDTLYFCDLYGRYGILKTTDGGATLTHFSNGFILNKDMQTSSLVIYPGSSDTLFVSTGESSDSHGRLGNGIFSSFDGGQNWNYSGLQGFSTPAINSSDDGRLLAGTFENGLYYSDDLGMTWIVHPDIPSTSTIQQIDKMNGVVAVSASDSGVYVSYDNCLTFSNIGMVGEFNFDLAIIKTTPNLEIISSGFFSPNRYNSLTGIWSAITDPLFTTHLLIGIGTNGSDIYCGIFSSTEIIKSNDGGIVWNQLSNNPVATEIPAVVVNQSNGKLYVTLQNSYNLSGVIYNKESVAFSTNNGLTWTRTGPLAHGLDLELDTTNPNILYLATFAQGVFRTTDGFTSWNNVRVGNKLIGDIEIDPDNPNTLLISEVDLTTLQTGIFKSTDGGITWVQTTNQFMNRIIYKPNSDTVFATIEYSGIFISTDKGDTWSTTTEYLAGENVMSLKYYNNHLYAGTENGKLFKINEVGNEADISGNWNNPKPVEVKNIEFIGNTLFVGLNGAEQDTLHNLSGSLWTSLDLGTSWNNISTDLTNTNIFGPSGFEVTANNELLVATYGQGVFKSNNLILSSNYEVANLKDIIKIFPNPTNKIFKIQTENVYNEMEISVYTILGERVLKIKNQTKIDISNLVSGTYFVKITIDGKVETNKVIKIE